MSDAIDAARAARIKIAAEAMIKALDVRGMLDGSTECIAAIAMLAGCVIAAIPDPEDALQGLVKGIRGIMTGELLD